MITGAEHYPLDYLFFLMDFRGISLILLELVAPWTESLSDLSEIQKDKKIIIFTFHY